MASRSSGLFVSFEGGEGSGKSTQAELLAESLETSGHQVMRVHDPGGTDLGEYLRDWIKSTTRPLTEEAELFLFAAARSELVRRVIRPALDDGDVVVADRYADSTTVYQGFARGLDLKYVTAINQLATGGLWPNLTVLLDAPERVGLARTRLQTSFDEEGRLGSPGRPERGDARRFEEESPDFHRRVREGYLALSRRSGARWFVVNADQPEQRIAEAVRRRALALLRERSGAREAKERIRAERHRQADPDRRLRLPGM